MKNEDTNVCWISAHRKALLKTLIKKFIWLNPNVYTSIIYTQDIEYKPTYIKIFLNPLKNFTSWLTRVPSNLMKNKTYHYGRLGIIDYSLDSLQKSITTLRLKFQMEPCQNCWHFSVMIPKVHSSDLAILSPFRRKWKVIILASYEA